MMIFSCLIARNLLSGLRTCEEVFRYMHNGGTSMPNRSLALNQHYPEDDTECIVCTLLLLPVIFIFSMTIDKGLV